VGRWSRFAVHGSWVAVRGSQFAIPALRRHTIVAWNVCYADVRAVWYVFHVDVSAVRGSRFRCSGATLFPRGTSVVGTFGRCGTSPVSSATCIRLTSFPTFSPCRSTRVVEGLAWERTPAPPLRALPAHIKGPGRRYTGVCVELTTGSPLSRGVSRCRSARPHCLRYLHNGCCIRGRCVHLQ
jgi:hypothetical protein